MRSHVQVHESASGGPFSPDFNVDPPVDECAEFLIADPRFFSYFLISQNPVSSEFFDPIISKFRVFETIPILNTLIHFNYLFLFTLKILRLI